MSFSNFLEFIRQFFLDFIGNVIPGLLLSFGIFFLFYLPEGRIDVLYNLSDNGFFILLLLLLSFVLGHFISEVGINIVAKVAPRFNRFSNSLITHDELIKKIRNSANFKNFVNTYTHLYGEHLREKEDKLDVHYWRNIALSVAPEGNQLVYKFRFLNLFNLGISTVLWIITFVWIVFLLINKVLLSLEYISTSFVLHYGILFTIGLCVLLFVISFPFLTRSFSFHRRTMSVPFSIALNKINSTRDNKPVSNKTNNEFDSIYLAGGFRSGWQDKVINKVKGKFTIIDPRKNKLEKSDEYTLWDLFGIDRSDIVFAYAEENNPGLYALSLEIGYAKGKNKFIILIDEKSKTSDEKGKYLEMIREASDLVFDNFVEGLSYLDNLKNKSN